MPEPRPFRVDVPESELAALRQRLALTRWPDEAPDAAPWAYGTDLGYLKELVAYWSDGFDWRAQERLLNELTQFTAPVAGIDLHFIHEPGVGPDPLPLLISHGWPSTVWEFHELIPLLTDPGSHGADPADAFTVVAPSLPGYGFSFAPNQPRFGIDEIADAFATLMGDVLGYDRYVASGGDWGAAITTRLAHVYPERLLAMHLNFVPLRRDTDPSRDPTPEELEYVRQIRHWVSEEAAYAAIQGTKPQTLAYGLTDSPAGLAGWIVEKFRAWSDSGGDVESRFTKDDLLTTISIFWLTGAIGSSFWPYYARQHGAWSVSDLIREGGRIEVPLAYAEFPAEIIRAYPGQLEQGFDVRRHTKMPRGGHFPGLEEPELLAADLRESFRAFRKRS